MLHQPQIRIRLIYGRFIRLKRPTRVLKAHKRKRLSNHQITNPFHQSG